MWRNLILIISTLTWPLLSSGAELFEYAHSVRALGMGMAYTALARDTDALYYNPAALSEITGLRLRAFDVQVSAPGEDSLRDLEAFSAFEDLDDLSELYGKKVYIGLGLKAAFAMPKFGFGVYDSGYANFHMSNPAMPSMNINYANDMGFVVGTGFHLAPGFSMGLTGKRILRQGYRGEVPLTTLIDPGASDALLGEISNKGWAYGLDMGFLFTQDLGIFKPSVAAMWKDAGYTSFQKESGTDAPPHIRPNQILGAAIEMDLPLLNFTVTGDYRHINDTKEDLGKKIHLGLEMSFLFLEVRGGFSQGYYTYGTTFDLWLLQIDAATYGVELGAYPGQTEDRRYVISISSELGFDPNFNLTDSSGRKRKLKQRR